MTDLEQHERECHGQWGSPCRHLPLGIGPKCHALLNGEAIPSTQEPLGAAAPSKPSTSSSPSQDTETP